MSILTPHLTEIPPLPQPKAAYTTAVRSGDLIALAGMLPFEPDGKLITGRLGQNVDVVAGARAARQAMAGGILVVESLLSVEELQRVRWLRIEGFVASAVGFTDQHLVMNGASGLVAAVFGPRGVAARFAVGVPTLPMGAAVEVAAWLRLE